MKEEVDVGKKLKHLRKERGLTLNNLAEKIGSDYQQISRIERGKSKLTIDTLIKMADALETPLTDLIETTHEEEMKIIAIPTKHEAMSHQKQPPSTLNAQDLLAQILVKFETTQQENDITFRPQTKAALAAVVYTQILQLEQNGCKPNITLELMTGWMEMMKTFIADLKNRC